MYPSKGSMISANGSIRNPFTEYAFGHSGGDCMDEAKIVRVKMAKQKMAFILTS